MAESPNYDTIYEITTQLAEERIDNYLRNEAGKPELAYCITNYPSHIINYLKSKYEGAGWEIRIQICQCQRYMRFIANNE